MTRAVAQFARSIQFRYSFGIVPEPFRYSFSIGLSLKPFFASVKANASFDVPASSDCRTLVHGAWR